MYKHYRKSRTVCCIEIAFAFELFNTIYVAERAAPFYKSYCARTLLHAAAPTPSTVQ